MLVYRGNRIGFLKREQVIYINKCAREKPGKLFFAEDLAVYFDIILV